MAKPGPQPMLNEKLFKQIRECILKGYSLDKTARTLNLNVRTFYVWHSDNYLNLADKIEGWKRDRLLFKSQDVLLEMIDLPVKVEKIEGFGEKSEKVVRTEPQLIRIKQDTAKFVAETLGKTHYSKRNELTGLDGERLFPKPLLGGESNGNSNNNSNEEVIEA